MRYHIACWRDKMQEELLVLVLLSMAVKPASRSAEREERRCSNRRPACFFPRSCATRLEQRAISQSRVTVPPNLHHDHDIMIQCNNKIQPTIQPTAVQRWQSSRQRHTKDKMTKRTGRRRRRGWRSAGVGEFVVSIDLSSNLVSLKYTTLC